MNDYEVVLILDTSIERDNRESGVRVLARDMTLQTAMLLIEAYSHKEIKGSEWIGIRKEI